MAYAASGSRADRAEITGRLSATLKNIGVRFDQYRVYRRTHAELSALSNRDLADLGINRSMITSIATEAAYGRR